MLCWWRSHLLWRFQTAFVGLLTFICLGRVRVVVAPRGRMLPLGGVRVFPVYLRSGRCRCCCVRVGNMLPLWGVVVGCGGVGCVCGVGMPRDCACWVRLRGFLVFGAWRCLPGLRVCACLYSTCLVRGLCRRVLLRVYAALFVGCVLLCRMLLVCCGLFCLSAIVWCAFRECSRADCDMVHAGWCVRAFDGGRGCRLLFTV